MEQFYELLSSLSLKEIAGLTNSEIDKKFEDINITNLASLETTNNESLIYFAPTNSISDNLDKSFEYKEKLKSIKAAACFISKANSEILEGQIIPIITEDPKLAFIKLTNIFYDDKALVKKGISKTAAISEHANFKDKASVHIGDFVVIEDDVTIGTNCYIGSGAKIKTGVAIGDNCTIRENAVIEHSILGTNVYIGENSVIGSNGFGWHNSKEGLIWVPQLGRVIMENNTYVGTNTSIDRGTNDDTVIGEGTKIDNLIQVGHNVKTGKYCILAGKCGIAGSTTLEDFVLVGAGAGISGHLTIGKGVQIGAGAGVTQNLKAGEVVSGYPAQPVKDFLKQTAFLRQMVKKKNISGKK